MAARQQSLNDLLKKPNKQENAILTWTEAADAAFVRVKESIADTALLVHSKPEALLAVTPPIFALEGVLQEYEDKGWQPPAFVIKKVQPNPNSAPTTGNYLQSTLQSNTFAMRSPMHSNKNGQNVHPVNSDG